MPKTFYLITGIIKHAQVARILAKNQVRAADFYIVARSCQEHLPILTRKALKAELASNSTTVNDRIKFLRNKGLIRTTYVTDPVRGGRNQQIIPTQQGWLFYLMLVGEMERPITDGTVYDAPKKTLFRHPKRQRGPKAGAAMKKVNYLALTRKLGLTIWERCKLSRLPQYQNLRLGAQASEKQASTSKPSEAVLPPGAVPLFSP